MYFCDFSGEEFSPSSGSSSRNVPNVAKITSFSRKKLGTIIFIATLPFSKYKFVVHFSNAIWPKTNPCTPPPLLLFIWKWITLALSFIWFEANDNVLTLWGPVFLTVPFFRSSVFSQVQGPVPVPVFRRCPHDLK